MNSTLLPWSRNHSAMEVATKAHLRRTRDGSLEVATTTTDFLSPSSPRDSSMKSRTSRPRSPMRQVITTSASEKRAICPIRVDLPTPEPANRPIRWPWPMVSRPSMARTPIEMCLVTRMRLRGSGAVRSTDHSCSSPVRSKLGPPSMGRPRPSTMRPSRPQPQRMEKGLPEGTTSQSGPTPVASPRGMSMTCSSRKPTTSQTIVAPPPSM